MKLDKTAFKVQSFEDASKHQKIYNELNEEERSKVFLYMMQAAYGFVGKSWPKMDKSFFKAGKLDEQKH